MKWISLFLCFIFIHTPLVSAQDNTKKIVPYKIPIIQEDQLQNKNFLNQNLGVIIDKEDLVRRGEITFFSSLAYVWVYQLIIFDVLFAQQFNDMRQSGKLSGTNFIYSFLTTILISLMITRKDTQFIQNKYYKEPVAQFSTDHTYYREQANEWRFMMNFMNYDF